MHLEIATLWTFEYSASNNGQIRPILRPKALRNSVFPPLTKTWKNDSGKITNKNPILLNLPLHHNVPVRSISTAKMYKSQFSQKLNRIRSHKKYCYQKNIGKN